MRPRMTYVLTRTGYMPMTVPDRPLPQSSTPSLRIRWYVPRPEGWEEHWKSPYAVHFIRPVAH